MSPKPFSSLGRFGGLLLCLLTLWGVPTVSHAFVLEGPRWPSNATVVMHLELGATNRTLSDGFAHWDDSAADALGLWNPYLNDGVQFQAVPRSTAPVGDGNGVNTVSYSETVFGRSFGADVLAVTLLSSTDSGAVFTEADTLFNSAKKWDSYRGVLRQDAVTGLPLYDFHRVAIHEFGHVLGLDHPDQQRQSVVAIMNSRVSDLDVMQPDDVDGVRLLYGSIGRLVTTLPLKVGQMRADPVRPRLYATLPQDNALAVIDTDTLAIVAQIPIGPNPTGLDISPDHARLYVSNSDPSNPGIGVVALDTLIRLPTLPVSIQPGAVAAGRDNRLYLLDAGGFTGAFKPGILQVDATTGAQTTFGMQTAYSNGFLQLSPDRNTLFYGNSGMTPSTLARFDAEGTLLQRSSFVGYLGSGGKSLTLSHHGQFLCFPNGTGNTRDRLTTLIPSNDVDGVLGVFPSSFLLTQVAFSEDDKLLYAAGDDGFGGIQIFDTQVFSLVTSIVLPYRWTVKNMAVTSGATGYLFVNSFEGTTQSLRVLSAASNPPRPAPEPAAVSVVGIPTRGGFVVSRTDGPLDVSATIFYHNGGSALRDADYVAFPGSVFLPAGQGEVVIPVTLLPGVNRNHKVKVFLDAAPDGSYQIGKAQSKVFLSDLL